MEVTFASTHLCSPLHFLSPLNFIKSWYFCWFLGVISFNYYCTFFFLLSLNIFNLSLLSLLTK